MPKYTIVLSRKAYKALDKLSDKIAEPILVAIERLEFNPRPPGFIKLKGREGYRIRVADYRIIYEVHDRILLVHIIELGHRKDIYK